MHTTIDLLRRFWWHVVKNAIAAAISVVLIAVLVWLLLVAFTASP